MRNWKKIEGFDFKEIIFEEYNHIAKITINRERYRNAFTPLTTWEMSQAFSYCRECQGIRVVILTGAGDKAFCSGGDMHVKGRGGYVGSDGVPRLNVLDVQMQIRRLPKPVIAMVNGYAIGGGHVLHVMCDLTIASENAIFGQTGPKVGSFDVLLEFQVKGEIDIVPGLRRHFFQLANDAATVVHFNFFITSLAVKYVFIIAFNT